ncbi:diguanylate cyclase [Mycobacterium sp. djl-10]|nr:diguanylate cyclase [Mycobacterium sp. djl-10]
MKQWADPEPTVWRWHAVGLVALLLMLGLYAVAGYAVGVRDELFAVLGAVACIAVAAALLGRACHWQDSRRLVIAWPITALLATALAGWVDPAATRDLPGTITITFAFVGLACGRGRSILLLPLGIGAFVMGADDPGLLTIVVTALMWVLVAEVPAWLIARLEAQSALLRRIAQTDALTQLLDRSTLVARMSEHATDAAVLLIDLDGFKQYNDRRGHEEGDRLLVAFADALRQSIRRGDLAFRLGGDEFLILLPGADQTAAEVVLAGLRQRWSEAGTPVSFSVGIAAEEPDLVRVADERMYRDKRSRGLPAD